MVQDCVIIGGGLAGLACANRLCELGKKPLVLEQGVDSEYPCNSRFSGGIVHVAFKDMRAELDDIQRVLRRLEAGAEFNADTALAGVLAEESARALEWLQARGVKFVKGGALEFMRWILAPPRPRRPGLDWKGRGPDVLLRNLTAQLEQAGGVLARGKRAMAAQRGRAEEPFSVLGESQGSRQTYQTETLVIADGGFQGNPEMVREHISARPEAIFPRGAATGNGDGLSLAKSLGADTVGMNRFYGHLLGRGAFENEKLWPYPTVDAIAQSALIVNGDAQRFVDEGLGGVYIANEVAGLPDPLSASVVFDEAVWTGTAADNRYPPCMNPAFVSVGGEVLTASTVPDLARAIQLDPAALTATVDEYNEAVRSGSHERLNPPRRQSLTGPQVLEIPPFRAIRVCAGMTYTMGGIRVDDHARVLTDNASVLSGLYAIGSASGGMEGGENAVYLGGLAKAVITGLRAAETIGEPT